MNYLLDTNVLSEVQRPRPDTAVLSWLDQIDEERLYLSVITVAELARGVALLPNGRRKVDLATWLEKDLLARFGRRILDVDSQSAFLWGRLMSDAKLAGRHLSVMDGWIAATALRHGLCLVTRNVRDFGYLGLEIQNPWSKEK